MTYIAENIKVKNQRTNSKSLKPINIGYTLGDLAGIGPEIFEKFSKVNQEHPQFSIKLIDEDAENLKEKISPGKSSAYTGEHAYKTLIRADQMLRSGEIDYLITGPVSKESLWLAGIEYSGQTELLASINNLTRDDIEMFFILDDLRVVLATRHVPITEVPALLEKRFSKVVSNSIKGLDKVFGIQKAKIAVAGLNPHAGENGLIGKEEQNFMKAEIEKFSELSGPFAADSVLAEAAQRHLNNKPQLYDLIIAAYHDQALPMIKGIGGFRSINITIGLPYLRLSVDHGTGFDIVGKDLASPLSLKTCTEFCVNLHKIPSYRVKS